ncbi:methyl-accepting chemotaxis protein [Marinobacter caseinilyticus]|uniref:methyl-accepting chemotaxis protein n=1 Tax=Marinobacter caseinilyticus TaxID=2692195 RepID=UPI00140D7ABA|nr:HAMP domain-containing methyl-accepting chemotaxis protein [Marinobacter caseinilyticus]
MNRHFFKELLTSRLLLPVFLTLVVAGAIQLMFSQWLINTQVHALTSAVATSLESGQARVADDFSAASSDVQQRFGVMREQTAERLSQQLAEQLNERQQQITINLKQAVIAEAQGLADALAAVAAPMIWDRDVPKLTGLIELVDARESVLFAAYYDQYGKRMTRYVDRTDERVKALMDAGEGRGAVGKVLDAASRDPDVVIITADIAPQGSVIGQLKLGLSTQTIADDMRQLEQQFATTVKNSAEAVSTVLDQQTGEVSQRLQQQLADIKSTTQSEIQTTVESIQSKADGLSDNLTLFAILSNLGLLVLIALVLGGGVLVKVNRLNRAIWAIADGEADLRKRVNLKGNNELTHMAAGMNQFIARIQSMVSQVNVAANTAADQARAQNAASREAVSAVNAQQQEIDRVSGRVGDMSGSIKAVANSIQRVAESVQSINAESKTTADISREARGGLDLMVADVNDAVAVVNELNNQSREIGSVLSVIGAIAEQTNLLALNAAIEAARAGESGRGFAVVADEVRTLASRTQQSTTEIQAIIDRLQAGSENAVTTISKASSRVVESTERFRSADEHFEQINVLLAKLQENAMEISASAEEQSAQANQISGNVQAMAESAESTVMAIRRSDNASQAIESVVRELQEAADQFSV